MLREVLPDAAMRSDLAVDETQAQTSPGLLSKHYAPQAPFTLYRGDPADALSRLARDVRARNGGGTVAVLAASEELDQLRTELTGDVGFVPIGTRADLGSISQRLYAALREADALKPDLILMIDIAPAPGLAEAIRDRLQRAATTVRQV
jgi:L-threonylcarbamoyladenylate synthase